MSRINQLRYLHESVKLGTMRAASDKLGVEPSTVSRQIAELEKALGIELIEKSRRKVLLTEAGRLTVEYFRGVIAAEDTYMEDIASLKSAKSGTIIMSTGDAVLSDSFSQLLDKFITAHSDLKIRINIGSAKDIINQVLDDESHFGLIFHTTTEPKISIRVSLSSPLQVVVNPSHPFAKRKLIELEEIAKEPLALPPESFQLRQIVHAAEKQQGIFFDCAFISHSVSLLAWFARSGKGITILSRPLIETDLKLKSLVAVPINSSILNESRMSLITRAGRKLPLVAQKFLVELERSLKKSSPY